MKKTIRKSRAFTLIELLVVISIIALLLSIMSPALSRAKESARLLICGTNLSNRAKAAFACDADYNLIPRSLHVYGQEPTKDLPCHARPKEVNDTPVDYSRDWWKYTGLPVDQWVEYGMDENLKQFMCPSAKWFIPLVNGGGLPLAARGDQKLPRFEKSFRDNYPPDNWTGNKGYRPFAYTSYFWFGGTDAKLDWSGALNMNPDNPRARKHRPLERTTDKNASDRVLAADVALYSPYDGENTGPGLEYQVNHPKGSNPGSVRAQNILYGDGSVQKHGGSNIYGEIDGAARNSEWMATIGGDYNFFW